MLILEEIDSLIEESFMGGVARVGRSIGSGIRKQVHRTNVGRQVSASLNAATNRARSFAKARPNTMRTIKGVGMAAGAAGLAAGATTLSPMTAYSVANRPVMNTVGKYVPYIGGTSKNIGYGIAARALAAKSAFTKSQPQGY